MKMKFKTFGAIASLFFASQALASLTLDATRYIYKGDAQAISATVTNNAEQEFGAQVWIDNIVETDTRPTFIATPSFFKVEGEEKQIFRIMKVSDHMPSDKESIYWMSVQEIPPAQEGSGIAMAIRTKVKLIYRPEGLDEGRNGAEQNLTIEHLPGEQWMVNSTPYIFAIGTVYDEDDNGIELSKDDRATLNMFMPGERVNVTGHVVKSVSALNDFGKVVTYELKQNEN